MGCVRVNDLNCINCRLSVEVKTLNLCVQSNFAWNSDAGGNLYKQFGFETMSPSVCCQIFSNLNVQDELMLFLMYVMLVEIKLAAVFELWSDLLPAQILRVGGLSKLWHLNWLFAHAFMSSISCFTFFGRCIGTSFHNGFKLKLDLNPGSTGTNCVPELSFH